MASRGRALWPVLAAAAVAALCAGGAAPAVGARAVTSTTTGSIVFAADEAPAVAGDIYGLSLSGGVKDLTPSPFQDTQPVVSPDSRWVAFLSNRGGSTALYVVGSDGSGLQRVSPPFHGAGIPVYTWSPNSRRLAVTFADGKTGALTLVGPGLRPVVIEHNPNVLSPAWSPDGSVITVDNGARVQAYTLAGKHLFGGFAAGGSAGWSRQGLFAAGSLAGKIAVYDERGHKVFSVRGDVGAWSPDGTHLAVFASGRLQVATTTGHVTFSKAAARLGDAGNGLEWTTNDQVVVLSQNVTNVAVDIETGKISLAPVYLARSPDGRFTADTVADGSAFALRVTGEGAARTFGDVPGCWEDSGFIAAIENLQFAPNDKALVYQSDCEEPYVNLWTVAPDGTQLHRLTTQQEEEQQPAWSPDGSTIAFSWSQHTGLSCKGCTSNLYLVNADGSGEHALTGATDSEFNTNPTWSPDGKTILYANGTPQSTALYEIPAGGGTPTNLHIAGEEPAWGPTRIAYLDTANAAVWTAAPDGSDRKKIAAGSNSSPEWSSSGELAWLQGPPQGGTQWIETSGGEHITLPFTAVRAFAWSPDGTQFVFAAQEARTATYDVYTMATNGTDVKRLTHDVDAYAVSWRA